MALARRSSKLLRKIVENLPVLLGTWSSEGVGEPVILCTDPGGLGPVVVDDLIHGVNAGHFKPGIVSRSAILDQPKTRF